MQKTISCNAIWRVLCGTAEPENCSKGKNTQLHQILGIKPVLETMKKLENDMIGMWGLIILRWISLLVIIRRMLYRPPIQQIISNDDFPFYRRYQKHRY